MTRSCLWCCTVSTWTSSATAPRSTTGPSPCRNSNSLSRTRRPATAGSASVVQTNHEGCFVEYLHEHRHADALLVNPGAWTHYSYAIRDALELVTAPVAEVHLSDITSREEWRRHSVISDVVSFTVSGKGADGYLEAVVRLVATADARRRGRTTVTIPASMDERLQRVRGLMQEEGVSALIVFAPADCRYLTGFTGEAASVVVTADELALVTDSRFTVQAEEEIPGTRVLLVDDGRDEPAGRFLNEAVGKPSAGCSGVRPLRRDRPWPSTQGGSR